MSPDLRFELLAITSIVSFLVMGGMLGLWAATSRWHWFVRAMVVVCLLALVQWRPLYELYLTLLTQTAVIAVGVAIYQKKNELRLAEVDNKRRETEKRRC